MISATKIRFEWPTVESTWDEIANTREPQISTLVAWKGKLVGEVLVRAFMVFAIVTYLPLLFVPRFPMGFRLVGVYGGGRAFIVRWLLWEFYFGPKPPTVVVPPPGAKELEND